MKLPSASCLSCAYPFPFLPILMEEVPTPSETEAVPPSRALWSAQGLHLGQHPLCWLLSTSFYTYSDFSHLKKTKQQQQKTLRIQHNPPAAAFSLSSCSCIYILSSV